MLLEEYPWRDGIGSLYRLPNLRPPYRLPYGPGPRCQFEVDIWSIASFEAKTFEPELCDDEATHEWHDGRHLCERHYNYLIEYWKQKRELAEHWAKETPPAVEVCCIDSTSRGQARPSVIKARDDAVQGRLH